jgi:hypothetical protein
MKWAPPQISEVLVHSKESRHKTVTCLMQRAITKYSTQKTETLETLDRSRQHPPPPPNIEITISVTHTRKHSNRSEHPIINLWNPMGRRNLATTYLDGSVDHLKKYSTIPRHIFFFFFFFTIVEEVKNPSLQFYIPRTRMSSWWISQIWQNPRQKNNKEYTRVFDDQACNLFIPFCMSRLSRKNVKPGFF